MIKVAIVHHDQRVVEIIQRAIKSQFEIIWTANQGNETILKCAEKKPEILLLDLDIKDLTCNEVIKMIMEHYPCGILILTNDVDINKTVVFKTLLDGALEVAAAPEPDLVSRIKIEQLLSKMRRIRALVKPTRTYVPDVEITEKDSQLPPLLIVGASTGGPAALVKLLSGLPKKPAIATVIVQHINERFTVQLADWLEQQTHAPVRLASHGDIPIAGRVLLSKADQHLVFNERLQLLYTDHPREAIHRPSIDVFFLSAAQFWPKKSVAVLLTGMGSDGADGMKKLHDEGWFTIAQHPEGCVVYGMPKAAVEKHAVSEVLKIEDMSSVIAAKISSLSFFQRDVYE